MNPAVIEDDDRAVVLSAHRRVTVVRASRARSLRFGRCSTRQNRTCFSTTAQGSLPPSYAFARHNSLRPCRRSPKSGMPLWPPSGPSITRSGRKRQRHASAAPRKIALSERGSQSEPRASSRYPNLEPTIVKTSCGVPRRQSRTRPTTLRRSTRSQCGPAMGIAPLFPDFAASLNGA